MENCSSEKKTDNESSVTERSIELAKRAIPKNTIFTSTKQSLKIDYSLDMDGNYQKLHIHAHLDKRSH